MSYLQYAVLIAAVIVFCVVAIRSNHAANHQLQEQIDGLRVSLNLLLTPVVPGPSQPRRIDQTPVTRNCVNCQREFDTAEPKKRYCSGACKNAFNRRRHRAAQLLPTSSPTTTENA